MKLLRNPAVLLVPNSDGYLAYEFDTGRLHRLNPLAALVVELADGSRTSDAIIQEVAPLTDEAGTAACGRWIEEASRQGLLVDADATGHRAEPAAAELRAAATRLRDNDQVLAAFLCQNRVVELAPDDPQDWYRLGELAHIIGRRADARMAYETYLQACPDDAEVEHLLVALRDETPPQRASDACIERIYGYFASFYDRNMCVELDYRAPELLSAALADATGGRRDVVALDAGCGTGFFVKQLRRSARRLVGVDLSADMIALARERGIYDDLARCELTAWFGREPMEAFDVIAVCDTLIYFGDLRQVLLPAVRHLAGGGVLAFTVEKGEADPCSLTDSGRFTHHRNHLLAVASEAGCDVVSLAEHPLRYEYGNPVAGWVAVLRRSS